MALLSKNRVVVAMSGGVDSSVAAVLLKEQGMEIIGVSMKTHDAAEHERARGKTCCTLDDVYDARRVCQVLDVPFYAINFKEEFDEKVIQYFGREYSQGRTPNPCVECNRELKFKALLKKAHELGAHYVATGHYAQKTRDNLGRYHLLKAKDSQKDQTYFLFSLTQPELEHTLFPLGQLLKEEVREIARKHELQTAEKPESQEICFVPDNDYASFIEKNLPVYKQKAGEFVDKEGNVLGEHEGVHAYTIGQRRGLGVAIGERAYVIDIQPETSRVVLGTKEDLLKSGLIADNVSWVHRDFVKASMEVTAKIRSRHEGVASILHVENGKRIKLEFLEPTGAVTPGQLVVFYHKDEVLGGGWIEKGLP